MAGVVGRAFKIKKSQAKNYGYVKPNKGGFRRNPGVSTIAAINGRGSYRSARASMRGLSANARVGRARKQLSAAEKKAFSARMSQARHSKNIGRMGRKRKPLRRRVAVAPLRRNRRRTSPGVHAANRRKTTTMKRNKRKAAPAATKRRRRRKTSKRRASSATKSPVTRRKRKAGKRRARKSRRKLRKNKGTSAGAKKGWRTRRRKKASKRRAAPKRSRRRRKARAGTKRRRKTSKKKTLKANRRRRSRRSLKSNRRRRVRRNGASMKTNRKRRSSRRRSMKTNRRRRHRRNGSRSMFRRNGGIMNAVKTGLVLTGGFALHRLFSNLFDQQVLARVLPAPAPVATSGLDALSKHSKIIASVLLAGVGSYAIHKVVKDEGTKKLLIGGVVLSAMQSVFMSLLNAFAPTAANMLSGPADGTAARLSAMYGLGHGASIQPRYGVINGVGEYFTNPVNGVGEYFQNPVSGVGEYLAVQGMQGIGTYERNPNLLEAAAGMGQYQEVQGTHIDPSSDLDRQLTIAEAAAGVGNVSPFEAAAGLQPFEASAGMGAIDTVPSSSTWIPGSTNPQLWAGVRPVNQPQAAHEMVAAGVLQTDGGQGDLRIALKLGASPRSESSVQARKSRQTAAPGLGH